MSLKHRFLLVAPWAGLFVCALTAPAAARSGTAWRAHAPWPTWNSAVGVSEYYGGVLNSTGVNLDTVVFDFAVDSFGLKYISVTTLPIGNGVITCVAVAINSLGGVHYGSPSNFDPTGTRIQNFAISLASGESLRLSCSIPPGRGLASFIWDG